MNTEHIEETREWDQTEGDNRGKKLQAKVDLSKKALAKVRTFPPKGASEQPQAQSQQIQRADIHRYN